ncbi:MAG: hypothetical protein JKY65_25470 [Planctomycetes bacterium]|nr:hypothetical protein [Planctomycetota bacterium]
MTKPFVAFALVVLALPAAAQTSKPAPTPTTGEESWPAKIRALHDKIVALPGKPDKPAVTAIRRLAGMYPRARAAMESIARKKLPIPHLAVSGGIMVAQYEFDSVRLCDLALNHPNPFVKLNAVEKLSALGGAERMAFLKKARPALPRSKVIDAAVARIKPTAPYTDRELVLLNVVMTSSDDKKINLALVEISVDHAQLAPVLERITRTVFLCKSAKMFGGITLAKIHEKDAPALKALTDWRRRNQKFVRYNAILTLHKHHGEVGKAHLKKLLENPKEPLRKIIEKLLKGEQKPGK